MWVGFDQPQTILPNGFAAEVAVPLWASVHEGGDGRRQARVVYAACGRDRARVCRLSGKLATEGCDDTYVEYFARGTEPAAYCDVHLTHGLLGRLAGLFSERDKPTPPRVVNVVSPPAAPATESVVQADPIAPLPPEPPKKRGFWARILGRK